jgi:hypothetical protein
MKGIARTWYTWKNQGNGTGEFVGKTTKRYLFIYKKIVLGICYKTTVKRIDKFFDSAYFLYFSALIQEPLSPFTIFRYTFSQKIKHARAI